MYLKLSVLSSSDNNVDTLAIFEVVKAPLRQRSAIRLSKGLPLSFVKRVLVFEYKYGVLSNRKELLHSCL